MEKFTKKWDDYINLEWKDYLFPKKISVIYPKEIYDGNFCEAILNEEFEKYYFAKKKYTSMYDYFEKEFEDYEKIELLSKEEEYKKYVKAVDEQAEKFKNEFMKKISEYSSCDFDNYKIERLEAYNIEDIDFKLLSLGKVNLMTRDTYRKSMPQYSLILATENTDKLYDVVFDININKFLTSYDDYYSNESLYKDNISMIDDLCVSYCHEYKVSNFTYNGNQVIICSMDDFCTLKKLIFEEVIFIDDFYKYFNVEGNKISIVDHYVQRYDDCYNVKFKCIFRTSIDNDLLLKEHKFEICYKNLKVETIY